MQTYTLLVQFGGGPTYVTVGCRHITEVWLAGSRGGGDRCRGSHASRAGPEVVWSSLHLPKPWDLHGCPLESIFHTAAGGRELFKNLHLMTSLLPKILFFLSKPSQTHGLALPHDSSHRGSLLPLFISCCPLPLCLVGSYSPSGSHLKAHLHRQVLPDQLS